MKTPARLEDLKPDQNNANQGTKRGHDLLHRSLEQHGAGRGIVTDKHGQVIGGNKTLEAAVDQGFGIEVVVTNGDELVVVQREDLDLMDGGRARTLAYLDNRVGEIDLLWDKNQILIDTDRMDLSSIFSDADLGRMVGQAKAATQAREDSGAAVAYSLVFTSQDALDRWRRFESRLEEMFPEESSVGTRLARFVVEQ